MLLLHPGAGILGMCQPTQIFLSLLKFKYSYDTAIRPAGITGKEMFADNTNLSRCTTDSGPYQILHHQGHIPKVHISDPKIPWFHTPLSNELRVSAEFQKHVTFFLASSLL